MSIHFVSQMRSSGLVCGLCLWYFLVIITCFFAYSQTFGALTRNFRLIRLRKFRDSGPPINVGEMLDELKWPSLEARRDQSSMLLFHKIHCGAVSIEKDNMTPAHSSKTTR